MPRMTARDRTEKTILPLKLALRTVAKAIGINVVAAEYGHGYTALANNLNPEHVDRAPTLQQFEDILTAGAARGNADPILDSIGDIAGVIFLRLPDVHCTDNPDLLEGMAELTDRVSRMMRHICESIADGHVDKDELSMLRKDVRALYTTAQALIAKAEAYGKGGRHD